MQRGKAIAWPHETGGRPLMPLPRLMFAREDDGRTGKDSAPRILIVEDDFLVALEMEAALSEAGFAVVGVANTAAEATEMAKASQPALAVMDIRLAGVGDGIDAALAIYHLYRIRSIFASAHGDETVRARAIGAAPLGWLQKPYSMASLVGAVRRALMEIGT